ncbi:Ig-like domain-containing protein [Clostridium cellulovorans]|uniref:Ig domain protein group 2 domain protein n=1 Tax=Clostridium cellulovorans (strain ATCC 35296 / DSM 3052 / OCM 3 / 743B) TaxID=573061 RepID=D9STD1_CLOC7|nr:Ig domain-containing protein [Clostridium cellulovorans]ADL50747.1 Ig domain protein group 2 domain protein [Clostridium cellulovorans 743B]
MKSKKINKLAIALIMFLGMFLGTYTNAMAEGTTGTTTYSENLIPKMNGYTTDGVTVSSSSDWSVDYIAWKAFNRNLDIPYEGINGNCWATVSGSVAGWLKVDFGVGNEKKVNKYTIKSRTAPDNNSSPKSWTFEGSNDNENWTVIDSRIDQLDWDDSIGEKREFTFSNNTKYRYYRINITANDGQVHSSIDELEMMEAISVSNVTLNKTVDTLNIGDKEQLFASVEPYNAANKNLLWKSDNPAVATVDSTGNVTAVAVGTAKITATTEDGSNLTTSCTVTVKQPIILISGIALNNKTLDLISGQSATLLATVTPDNATNKKVIWTSSNPSVATVDSTGKITAVASGTATITATTIDGTNLSDSCAVNVKADTSNDVLLTIYLTNGNKKSYAITDEKLDDFLNWYNDRAAGIGKVYYGFEMPPVSSEFKRRVEYVMFSMISDFVVDEYK